MRCNNILDAIGQTPLIRLHRIGNQLDCQLWAKAEFLNPGGSIKDRIAHKMIEDAEASGRIKPGDTLIEPTSGNTGIGIALAGAVKGYRVIITMPEKMSKEKQVVLEALGAEIIRTPTEAAFDAPESHISVAKRLQAELPRAHILNQYSNLSNPHAHYEHTAQEIIDDLDGKVDMVVMGAGTGGTITGVAKRLKEHNPDCIIIGADPEGSILAGPDTVSSYKVEGIGYDFVPDVLKQSAVDYWVKTNDRNSFQMARRLIREEGLLVGGSCGAAVYAALKHASKLKKGQNCVVILPDGVRNYMTKFINDKWMVDNEFSGPDRLSGKVNLLIQEKSDQQLVVIEETELAATGVEIMGNMGISQIPVVRQGVLTGILTEDHFLKYMAVNPYVSTSRVSDIMDHSAPTVTCESPISSVQSTIEKFGMAVVVNEAQKPLHILTKIDLVNWMAHAPGEQNKS